MGRSPGGNTRTKCEAGSVSRRSSTFHWIKCRLERTGKAFTWPGESGTSSGIGHGSPTKRECSMPEAIGAKRKHLPAPSEYLAYYGRYIDLLEDRPLVEL